MPRVKLGLILLISLQLVLGSFAHASVAEMSGDAASSVEVHAHDAHGSDRQDDLDMQHLSGDCGLCARCISVVQVIPPWANPAAPTSDFPSIVVVALTDRAEELLRPPRPLI